MQQRRGTEEFRVKSFDAPLIITFADGLTHKITSDGLPYDDGVCSVSATFNLNDARLAMGTIKRKQKSACGGVKTRVIRAAFTDRADDGPPHPRDGEVRDLKFMNIDHVEHVTQTVPVLKKAAFNGVCSIGVRFNPDDYPGTDFVEVFQNPDGTWTVRAQPPNDVAVCINLDDSNPPTYYHMPFELTVEKK
jgi:hypothetical protein